MYKKEDIMFELFASEITLKARRNKAKLWIDKGFKKYPYKKMVEYWKNRYDKNEANTNFINLIWKEWLEKRGFNSKNDIPFDNQGRPILPRLGPNQPANYPPARTMVKNFANSLIEWTKKGFKVVNEEQFNERLNICKGCDLFDKEALRGAGRCMACGCATQAKLRIATEKCPKDKWLQVTN